MELESVLQDVIKSNEIRELYLKKIPVLITCDNWKKVVPIGWVEHKTNLAFYRGGLVELKGRIYFVSDKTIDALSEFIDFKFKNKIHVIME
ncbi:MAG: hypothetical protein V1874_01660 [Spirochaetota bacterium]